MLWADEGEASVSGLFWPRMPIGPRRLRASGECAPSIVRSSDAHHSSITFGRMSRMAIDEPESIRWP